MTDRSYLFKEFGEQVSKMNYMSEDFSYEFWKALLFIPLEYPERGYIHPSELGTFHFVFKWRGNDVHRDIGVPEYPAHKHKALVQEVVDYVFQYDIPNTVYNTVFRIMSEYSKECICIGEHKLMKPYDFYIVQGNAGKN